MYFEKIRVKNFRVKIFLWVWQTTKIKHVKIWEQLNKWEISDVHACTCIYACVHELRSCTRSENPRSASCPVDELLWVWLLGMELGFCSWYNNDQYAYGILVSHHKLGHRTRCQAGQQCMVLRDLEAYFSVWNSLLSEYLMLLCSKISHV